MKCPACDSQMKQTHEHGVDVNICPKCKGVWLARSEWEKVVEKVERGGAAQMPGPDEEVQSERGTQWVDREHERYGDTHYEGHR